METSGPQRRFAIRDHRGLILACAPIAFAGCVVAWYAWVNAKAVRMVDEHIAWMEEMGYPVSMEEFYQIPDNPDDDMLQHPAMVAEETRPEDERLLQITAGHFGHRISGLSDFGMNSSDRQMGEVADVRTFFDPVRHAAEAEAARELLDALAPEIKRARDLGEAFARPIAGWRIEPTDYEGFTVFQSLGKFTWFRMCSFLRDSALLHLAASEPDRAAENIHAILNLCERISQPPLVMVDAMIGVGLMDFPATLIHDGIARQAWSDQHLAGFESRLSGMALEARYIDALRGELTYAADILQQMRDGRGRPALRLLDDWEWDQEIIQERLGEIREAAGPHGFLIKRMFAKSQVIVDEGIMQGGKPRLGFDMKEMVETTGGHGGRR